MIFNINDVNGVVLIVDFEQANIWFVHIEKVNIFEDKIGHIMRYVSFKCEQNLVTSSIWTYTIKTLRVNQWEIFAKKFISDVDSG